MVSVNAFTTRERLDALLRGGGRAALAATLALSLGAGALAAPSVALASDEATFTVVAKDNAHATYRVYRLFKADIAANDGSDADYPQDDYPLESWPGIATHASWNDEVKNVVLALLDENGFGEWLESQRGVQAKTEEFAFQRDVPQNAIEFIAEHIGASEDDKGAATAPATKAAGTFALELARVLAAAGAPYDTCEADDEGNARYTGEEGYYLFVTDDESVGAGESGTAPIWVPLGGATSAVVEKTAIPTLDKQVKEDSTGTWGKVADANRGQDLEYRLTATMPDNVKSFDAYYLMFSDQLPEGLELADGATKLASGQAKDVKVWVHYTAGGDAYDVDATDNAHVSIGYEDNRLVVAIDDLKGVYANLDKTATVTVEYTAHLTDEAAMGQGGNLNSAQLAYASNPVTSGKGVPPQGVPWKDGGWKQKRPDGTGETPEGSHKTRTCTWQIALNKADKATHVSLADARFTVQVAQADKAKDPASAADVVDEASVGKYVQADGSLADKPHEFVTDAEGNLVVPRVDSGVYVVRETRAPAGYELQDADVRVAITPELDQDTGKVVGWSAAVSGGEATTTNEGDVVTHLAGEQTSLDAGVVTVQTSDDKKPPVPVTGMAGTAAGATLAGGVLLFSIAGLYRNRRKQRAEDAGTAD